MFNFLNMVRFFQKWYLLIKFENDKKRIYSDWIFCENSEFLSFYQSTRKVSNMWLILACVSWVFSIFFSNFVKFYENRLFSSTIITWLQKRRPTEKINWTLECNYTILSPREYQITFDVLDLCTLQRWF